MAEFCLDCWNKIYGKNYTEKDYVLSRDLDLCEGCGEFKRVIEMERKAYYLYKFRFFIFPFKVVYYTVYILLRLIILPYLIYKYWPRNK